MVNMSKPKSTQTFWDEIFDNLILENEPPIKYITDAVIVTKSGAKFRVSPDDYAHLIAREKQISPEQSDIHSCSLSIDFARIKRDINRWANKFISEIETEVAVTIAKEEKSKRTRSRQTPTKKPKSKTG